MWTNLHALILLPYYLDSTTVTFGSALSIRNFVFRRRPPLVNGSVVTVKSIRRHIVARIWHYRDMHDINEHTLACVGVEPISIVLYLFTRSDWTFDFFTWDDGCWSHLTLYMLPRSLLKSTCIPWFFVSTFLAAYLCCITVSCACLSAPLAGDWPMGNFLLRSTGISLTTMSCKFCQQTEYAPV